MSTRTASMLLAALLNVAGGAADPADSPALEWIEGEAAAARIGASEGVVFVDLHAHY